MPSYAFPDTRESSLPPSDIPSDLSSVIGKANPHYLLLLQPDLIHAQDFDGSSSSDEEEMHDELKPSETLWLDKDISSLVRVGEFRVTKEVTVQRVEYVTGFPSLFPIPETSTAFVIDADDRKFDFKDKHGSLYTIDAVIKNKVCTAI
jgi:hypothetical protein